jgi:tellurite resistance protein
MLPAALQPTLAIEVAPAAVASLAWFQINGHQIDVVMSFLAGYGLLMVIAQLRLLPAFLRLPFMPSTWAFTFSWSAVASMALIWLQEGEGAAYRVGQYLVLAVITLFVGGIAVRSVVAILRRQLLPHPPAAATVERPRAERVSTR